MTTSPSSIQVRDNPAKHRFEYAAQGERAVAIYSLEGNVITFIHTLVPEALQGQGIAKQLVLAGLASARERGLRVVDLPGSRRAEGSWLGPGTPPVDDTRALRLLVPDIADRDVFVCGPTAFIGTAADILVALGHDPKKIKTERFGGTA